MLSVLFKIFWNKEEILFWHMDSCWKLPREVFQIWRGGKEEQWAIPHKGFLVLPGKSEQKLQQVISGVCQSLLLSQMKAFSAWSVGGGEEQSNHRKYACGHITSGCDLVWPRVLHQDISSWTRASQGLVARLEHRAAVLPCICVRSMS